MLTTGLRDIGQEPYQVLKRIVCRAKTVCRSMIIDLGILVSEIGEAVRIGYRLVQLFRFVANFLFISSSFLVLPNLNY